MKDLKSQIQNGEFDQAFKIIYADRNNESIAKIRARYTKALEEFKHNFPAVDDSKIKFFSAPGRTEIGGNHTDHQLGIVVAGSVDKDMIAAVVKDEDRKIRIFSKGYGLTEIDIKDTDKRADEEASTAALIRGIVDQIQKLGFTIEGFNAYIESDIPSGSGISSSAAFEILIATIINDLFCNNELSPTKLAQIGQYAENIYFGKPSGLMDQLACSTGGIIKIDFKDRENPSIEKIDFDLENTDYSLYVIDSKSSHEDLTAEYASIPEDMRKIAEVFGKEYLSEIDSDVFNTHLSQLRDKCGDRAVLRALHFFNECQRAEKMSKALDNQDFSEFLRLVNESGNSSVLSLQNIWPVSEVESQGLTVALSLAQNFLEGRGASRVHGGGFAGTIQVYVPKDIEDEFVERINTILGSDVCMKIKIRPVGGVRVDRVS